MEIIGIDLGGTKIDTGIVSDNGLEKVVSKKVKSLGTQQEVISQITETIDELLCSEVKGIGIGVPAIVNVKKGIVYETVNIPSWKKVPLKDILEKKYQIPVKLNNDANCFVLAEKYFGKGKSYQNIVGLTIGTGLGAGIIINDKLHSGHNCGAGEFGEIVFKEHNIEHYCSGQFFENKYKTTGEKLFEQAKQNNLKALKIFREFGENLGEALSMIVHSVDPEIIILGGSVSNSAKYFKKSMKDSLKKLIYEKSYSELEIEVSKTNNIAILGAASLYFDSLQ